MLTPGTRLGVYEVASVLGVGGMGEVYRARDTRLQRDVAIKVLPEVFASDPDRLARFEREAQLLASLNHPHIGAIYGLEESGGVRALILELVEGPTLADRIAEVGRVPRLAGRSLGEGRSGPAGLPIDEALSIAKQVADALEAAHEQGITHRDLKPANIKVRSDGRVKVLDFGLAKLNDPNVSNGPNAPNDLNAFSQAPTITSPAMPFDFRSGHPEHGRGVMTQVGMILGTAAYMAPEQAKGRPADKRSDLWAFGCVLYEMLTGKGPFAGDDMSDTLANVLKREPDWTALPAEVPPALRALLRRCLEKDRRERVADISTALFVLKEQTGPTAPVGTATGGRLPRRPLGRRVAALTGGALAIAAGAGAAVWFATRPAPLSVVRMTITTSGPAALSLRGTDRDVAITPDGSRIVYRGNSQLLVRALNQLEPTVLGGLGEPQGVFISPDGQWIGFSDGTTIKKVAITGGPPVTVAPVGRTPRGATWGADGTIIFATGITATGLQRVSAAGGEPSVLTKPDRGRGDGGLHVWPEFLPGGEAVLFTITGTGDSVTQIENAQVAVLDLQTGTSKVLIRGGSHAHYVSTGHLVYGVAGTLRAVAFDLGRLEVVGTPVPVLDGVVTTASGAADVAVAANGSLVYVPGVAGAGDQQTVVSVDRQGRASLLPDLPLDSYRSVRVSPDGTRLALSTPDDVWTYDFARATRSRLTTDPALDRSPLWTPDGRRIIFTSNRAGYLEMFGRSADGAGGDERVLSRARDLVDLRGSGWSADGRQLLFIEVIETPPSRQSAIWQVAIERPSDTRVLLKSAFSNDDAAVSPNGRWMAYHSNFSGRNEIYVQRYPELGNRQLISTGGGQRPVWSRDGKELFFGSLDGRQMLAVPVQSGPTFVAGRPQVLFEFAIGPLTGGSRPYDIAPDGRFFIIRSGQAEADTGTASNLIVVQNWTEELKRLVPTN